MGAKLGMEARMYFSPTGLIPPTWINLLNVKDVTLNLEAGEADVTTRMNNGWRATLATLKEGSVEFEMVWDPDEPGFWEIQNAYFGNVPIALAVMDGDIQTPGTQGLVAYFTITNLTRSEPLEEAITASVTAKPTYSTYPAQWVITPPTP